MLRLNPCYNGMTMEFVCCPSSLEDYRLNPCYNGMTMEYLCRPQRSDTSRLNPCYNGMTMEYGKKFLCLRKLVLILVIME